jgi:hypothetical protein
MRSLVEHAMRFGTILSSFHTEFAKFTSIQTKMGQKELRELSSRVHELGSIMREYVKVTTDAPPCTYHILRLSTSVS